MRTTGRRSFVLYILLAVGFAGAVWLLILFFTNGKTWATQSYNKHLSVTNLGSITDSDGTVLASTQDGSRVYVDEEAMRRALLHTVGDTGGDIQTSIQSTMRAKLSGYNPITGAGNSVFNQLGKNIQLTINAQVCLTAYQALNGKNGAVIAYNYETGEIVCKVSTPTFDPSNVPEDLMTNESGAYDGMLIDNTLRSTYVPGSTFKLVTQAAAMDQFSDWSSREYVCNGSVNIGGNEITCLGNHGTQTAYSALGNSCNVYYALLANDIGTEALQAKAEEFGFNENLTFGDIVVKSSKADLSGASGNELAWAGVGQYTMMVNPYHMMTLMGAIANGGTYVEPKLTDSLNLLEGLSSGSRKYMDSTQAASLKEMMRNNVSVYYGDALFPEGMQVCAKTGTGEVGGGKSPTCWMVGFSDSSSTPYAFVVVVEEGSGGIETAGAVASSLMKAIVQYM